jgi:hypothetical protein
MDNAKGRLHEKRCVAIARDANGSPIVAFKTVRDGKVPFSQIYIADESEESGRIAQRRLTAAGVSVAMEIGPAKDTAVRIAKCLNKHGLHLVLLDPFSLEDLGNCWRRV